MPYRRTALQVFSLSNDAYKNAVVTFYVADLDTGLATSTLATLYEDATSSNTLSNPYTLNAEGKFSTEVYHDVPVIAQVSGASVGDHGTGIIMPRSGSYQGEWETGTVYLPSDIVKDGANGNNTGNLYGATTEHTSGTFSTDVLDGKLALILDIGGVSDAKDDAETAATNAETSATAAAASATAAASSAADAAAVVSNALNTTSSTSLAIATGTKIFTLDDDLPFQEADYIQAASDANNANYMYGQVVSKVGTTLTTSITLIGGSGTLSDWIITKMGPRGPAGSGLSDVVDDTSPQLGGDLDVNGNSIVSVSNGDIDITPNGTGNTNITNLVLADDMDTGGNEIAGNGNIIGHRPLNEETTTSVTLALDDAGKMMQMNNASATTLTVPPNSSVAFPTETEIDIINYGAGQVTLAPGAGVTIRSKSGNLSLDAQYSAATLKKLATDEWILIGDLS